MDGRRLSLKIAHRLHTKLVQEKHLVKHQMLKQKLFLVKHQMLKGAGSLVPFPGSLVTRRETGAGRDDTATQIGLNTQLRNHVWKEEKHLRSSSSS